MIRRALARDGRGAAMLEFAVVAPVVILLMLGMADLALVSAGNNAGGNGAREGARYGIINFDCADAYSGSATYDSLGCTTSPSANYTAIVNVVTTRISGLVKNGTISVAIRCIDGSSTSLTSIPCIKTATVNHRAIVSDQDLIEVKVTWTSLGASPYAASSHTDLARLMIQGVPSTTAVGATSTTTIPPTTTTTAPATTTTTNPCANDSTAPAGDFSITDGAGADAGYTNNRNLTLNMNYTDLCLPMTMQFSTDGGSSYSAYAAYAVTAAVTVPVGDGTKSVFSHVKDNSGNVASANHSIVLDTTVPTTSTLTRTSCSTSGSNKTTGLSWTTPTEVNLKQYVVSVNNGSTTTTYIVPAGTTTYSYTDKKQDTYTFTVQAFDKAGNSSAVSNSVSC